MTVELVDRGSWQLFREGISVVSFAADGSILAGGQEWDDETDDAVGRLIRVADGRVVDQHKEVDLAAHRFVVSPGSERLAIVGLGGCSVRPVGALDMVEVLVHPGHPVHSMVFPSPGRLAVCLEVIIGPPGIRCCQLAEIDIASGISTVVERDLFPVNAFARHGRYLAGATFRQVVYLWDVTTWKLIAEWEVTRGNDYGMQRTVNAVAFSAGGSRLVTAGDHPNTLCVWEVPSARRVTDLDHDRVVKAVAPLAGDFVASGDGGGVIVWDLGTGRAVAAQEVCVHSLAASPDGRQLVVGDSFGELHLYDVRY